MSGSTGVVLILDDDATVCRSLQRMLESRSLRVLTFTQPAQFFAGLPTTEPFCLVLDVNLGTEDGWKVLRKLRTRGCDCPVIMLTAYGDVPMAMSAMRAGAMYFMTKPYNPEELVTEVRRALDLARGEWEKISTRAAQDARASKLTPRERQVLSLAASGLVNKQIAARLDLAEITVKIHRSRAMRRLGASTAAELARFAAVLDIAPASSKPPAKPSPPARARKREA